jgi:hypothetical protein
MGYIAKKIENQDPLQEAAFELFETLTLQDVTEKSVTIKNPIGYFTISDLENERKKLMLFVDQVDQKLAALKKEI